MNPALQHAVWDFAAWLLSLGLLLVLVRWRAPYIERSSLKQVGRGYYLCLSAGGLAGAYGIGTANLWASGQPGFARSIVGGLAGAIIAVEFYKRRHNISGSTGGLIAPVLAFGIALGRVGCNRAGLADFTYGTASSVPWAVDYGDHILRHPVALYESAACALLAAALVAGLWRAPEATLRKGFYMFCMAYGAQRFGWEFLKPYARLIGPFNLFHFVCGGLIVYASVMLWGTRDAGTASP